MSKFIYKPGSYLSEVPIGFFALTFSSISSEIWHFVPQMSSYCLSFLISGEFSVLAFCHGSLLELDILTQLSESSISIRGKIIGAGVRKKYLHESDSISRLGSSGQKLVEATVPMMYRFSQHHRKLK